MGDHLGPYELRGELGRGAMAIVWRGYDPHLRREVAIKEPVIAHGTSPEVAAELSSRFVREGRAVASLSHPGIVTVYSSDIYDGRPAIVMELIEGSTLREVLDTQGALTIPGTVAVADQILEAIGYAHDKGVVHRDLKPDNVFLTTDGRVKIADFGIAHLGTGTALTQQGTVMGTPGYMAPEQVRGEQVDARADLFSVGVLIHEMLTGSNPFLEGDAHPTAVMYRVLNEQLPDVRTGVAETPVAVAATVAIATTKEVSRRFSSAPEMRRALSGATAVKMPSDPGRGRSRTTAVVAAVAVTGVIVLGAAGFAAMNRPEREAPAQQSPATSSTPATQSPATVEPAAQPDDMSKAASEFGAGITVFRPTWTHTSADPVFEYGTASGGPFYTYKWESTGTSFEGTVKNANWGRSEILAEQVEAALADPMADFVPVKMGEYWVYPVYGSGVSQFIFLDPQNVDSRGVPSKAGAPYYVYETSSPDDAEKFIAGLEKVE